MKPKYPLIPISIVIVCLLIFGYTFESTTEEKDNIPWSARKLNWDDFELVHSMEEDYVALIHSSIMCPNLITDANSKVYAYMNPNRSQRLRDQYDSYNVLVHEQYHFNITEYCARLLRKDIVELGLGGLSFETMKKLKTKYSKKLDSLQTTYDSITGHNANTKMQRYWELQIDDWLRQTAYYQNEDIHSYYNFTKNRTQFFKYIYFTSTQKVLTSYPVSEKDIVYGETYGISYPNHKEKVVKFYKDGKLTNGGYFETAITKIINKEEDVFEIHCYNPDETYNTMLPTFIRKTVFDEDGHRVDIYLDKDRNRVTKNSIYETQWKYNSKKESYYISYYNQAKRKIANENGIFHQKRKLDKKGRTVLIENFDALHRLSNDNDHIARYEKVFNENHRKLYYRLYDESGNYAFHLNDYHLAYEYDERGNSSRITSLNEIGEKAYDKNGASIYEYTYDLYDRETSVKRFIKNHMPVIADDDYFQKVFEYDSLGRVKFEAHYYPGYVLRFTDDKDGAIKYNRENDSIILEYNVDAYNEVFENKNKIAIVKYTLNAKKEVIKETYMDSNNNFAKTEDGVVTYKYKYDTKGNKIETVVYDSLGNQKEFEADVARIQWQYDNRGNKLKTTYFTKNNELAYATDSVTYNVYEYNKKNQLVERRNYDIEMKPSEIDGTYKTRFLISSNGLDSLMLQYNAKNQLRDGVAITKYFYNKYGNETRVEYYDSKNRRVRNADGISAMVYKYNKRQQLVGYAYFDEQNKPTNNQNGVALERWTLDELGHILTYAYFNKYKRPVLGDHGYHKIAYEWSEIGQATKTTAYDTDLKLIEDEYGTAIYKYTLGSSGLAQIIERYNKEGLLAENSNNVAVSHYENRLNGLYFLEKELNTQGEVVHDTITE